MGSQLDLDQGGTFRESIRLYMGPSVGWVQAQQTAILPVTTAGTTTVLPGSTLITVNNAGAVTIQLPSSKASAAGAQAIPGSFVVLPVTVVDIGGFASSGNPITVVPAAGETIDGAASVAMRTPYGAINLRPNIVSGGWNLS